MRALVARRGGAHLVGMGHGLRLLIAGVLLLAGGCTLAPRLAADVETFSALDASPAPAAIAVVPFTGIDGASLEFRRYREVLAAALQARGFEVVAEDAAPRWEMRLGWRVGAGRERVRTFDRPGFRHPRYRGGGRGFDPFFDGPEVVVDTVYGRHLALVLADRASGEEVWRASVFNLGARPALSPVVDAMIAAAFADFPQEGARRVVVTREAG